MTEIAPSVPLWDWYMVGGDAQSVVKAIHMDKDFSYTTITGTMRGRAGDWLVEERNGRWQQAIGNEFFRENFSPVLGRPEEVQPPEPAPEPLAPEVEPPSA